MMNWQDDLIKNADPNPSVPQIFHSEHGDCVEVFFATDAYFGKRVDGLVTVYISEESGKPVGILMKGIKSFLAGLATEMPNVGIDFHGENFSVEYLITAYLWTRKNSQSDTFDRSDDNRLQLVIQVRDAVRSSRLDFDTSSLAEC